MLDVEVTGAVAPAANIVDYFARNTNAGFTNAIAAAVHDETNKPSVISISWGGPGSTWTQPARTALDQVLREATMQGITVVVAAGDNGVTTGCRTEARISISRREPLGHVGRAEQAWWPTGNTIASETACNSGAKWRCHRGRVSDVFAQSDWQANAGIPARKDRSLGRGVPDVAGSGSRDRVHRLRKR